MSNEKLVIGLQIKEQAGFGIVDVRLVYRMKAGTATNALFSDWVTGNPNIDRLCETVVPGNGHAFGLEAKEQAGCGIVDMRLVYNDASS